MNYRPIKCPTFHAVSCPAGVKHLSHYDKLSHFVSAREDQSRGLQADFEKSFKRVPFAYSAVYDCSKLSWSRLPSRTIPSSLPVLPAMR